MKKSLFRICAVVLMLALLVGAAPSTTMKASAESEAPGFYFSGDIAAINAIIEDTGLKWEKADPADGSYIPDDWKGEATIWSDESADRRINALSLPGEGLTGELDLSGLTALEYLDCRENKLTSLNL